MTAKTFVKSWATLSAIWPMASMLRRGRGSRSDSRRAFAGTNSGASVVGWLRLSFTLAPSSLDGRFRDHSNSECYTLASLNVHAALRARCGEMGQH
jgi:hypothetical protein